MSVGEYGGFMNWINVNDRLPEKDVISLCCTSDGHFYLCRLVDRWDKIVWVSYGGNEKSCITHWHPLTVPE